MTPTNQSTSFTKRSISTSILLFGLVFIIYSNTFEASWHLDDYENIVNNPRLHLNNLQLSSLGQTFFASINHGDQRAPEMYRPTATLSFGLNWYFGKAQVTGYHMVNLMLHCLTALFLYLTILIMFRAPNLKTQYEGSQQFIAALAAVLWAVNPIQTQAVTYIVQRMAVLAAMFYIAGIYCYVKARITEKGARQILLYAGCLICYILALGSKANAATLPVALILIETVFFQNLSLPQTNRKILVIFAAGCVLVVLIGAILFLNKNLFGFLKGYAHRPFTLFERLMTQPRMLIFYLSQIFYPIPSRLSITHDIAISTSLLQPWTTLPAMMAVLLGIAYGIMNLNKRRFIAFGLLFFVLNHLIESTILPLELFFEHRNYLPSLFLFVPLSVGIHWILGYYKEKTHALYLLSVFAVTLLLIALGIGTYVRNMAWANEKSLWEDALTKAPESSRPYGNLADYYEKHAQYDKALALYQQALVANDPNPKKSQVLALSKIGGVYGLKGNFENAIRYFRKALAIDPEYEHARFKLALAFYAMGKWNAASETLDLLLKKHTHRKQYLKLKGYALVRDEKYKAALRYFKMALRTAPFDKNLCDSIGVTLNLMGHYDRAEWFLKRALQMSSNNILTFFYLIENRLNAGDTAGSERYLEKLFNLHSIKDITTISRGVFDYELSMTFSQDLLVPVISKKIKQISREIKSLEKNIS